MSNLPIFRSSFDIVQDNRINMTRLSKKQIELLLSVNSCPSQNELQFKFGKAKQTMSSRLNRLKNKGLIDYEEVGNSKVWHLTPTGKTVCTNFLTSGEFDGSIFRFRVHNLCFTSKIQFHSNKIKIGHIVRIPIGCEGIGSNKATVLFYPNSVQFNLPPIYSYSIEFAMKIACEILIKIIDYLEKEYVGLKLGKSNELAHVVNLHVAMPFHPLAVEYAKSFKARGSTFVVAGQAVTIDFSEGSPEFETIGGIEAKSNWLKIISHLEKIASE